MPLLLRKVLPCMLAASVLPGLTACQLSPAPQPAVLDAETPEAMSAISTVLSGATGRATIELGATDLTKAPAIPVLPPRATPAESNSPAMPLMFDLMVTDAGCFVQNRETGDLHALPGIVCRPLPEPGEAP